MTQAKTPPKHRADFTAYSAVIVCLRPSCMWRCQTHAPRGAWRLYAAHCRNGHDDAKSADYAARRAFQNVQVREAGSQP